MATVNRIDDTLTETRWREDIRETMHGEPPLRQAEELAAIAATLAPAIPALRWPPPAASTTQPTRPERSPTSPSR